MGLLYTTEGTRNILDTLNTAFDGPSKGLQIIRDAVQASKIGDQKLYNMVANPPWKRGHLATTLELFPYNQGPGSNPNFDHHKARWAFFLRTVVGGKFDELCKAISEAILDTGPVKVSKVSFFHVEKGGAPNLLVYYAPMTNDLNGPYAQQITLFTRNLKDTGDTSTFDPPDPGNDGLPLNPPWKRP